MTAHDLNTIRLKGVRQNNLKGFDLDIPLGQLVVVTGLSGAGKSSLVFETLHAEGQRRYVETFSPYTRQFLEMLDRPDVEDVENIRPSIAIEQTNTVKTSRSTVGTMTELCDFFKVWFCHRASLYDPETGEKIEDDNPQTIWRKVLERYDGQTVLVGFEIRRTGKLTWATILESVKGQGYARIATGKETIRIDDLTPETLESDSVIVVQDRIKVKADQHKRFLEAATTALHFGKGHLQLLTQDGAPLTEFTEGLHSPGSNKTFRPATPAAFSFNSPIGACPTCRGFGRVIEIDYRLVIPDRNLSLREGAIAAFQGNVYGESLKDLVRAAGHHNVRTDVPWKDLSPQEQKFVIEGEHDYTENSGKWYGVRRFFSWLESNVYKMHVRIFLSKFRAYVECPDCKGTRLKPEALNWKWEGYTLPDLYNLPLRELLDLLRTKSSPTSHHQADLAENAILTRLNYLDQVGLGYLTLNRSSRTLSGGEVERVNLTSCLGTSLVDTLFVLDEPSVGLHARDIDRLIAILRQLTAQGNTVIVVEHDDAIMRAADRLIEIGPEPGKNGGNLVFNGTLDEMLESEASITGAYLSGRKEVPLPEKRRPIHKTGKQAHWLHFEGITKHNLKEVDVSIPLQRFVAFSGVSGSGKSTLLNNVVYQGLLSHHGKAAQDPAAIRKVKQTIGFSETVLVDQSPVSRTPRSNAALFVDAWDPIRNLFASTPEAKDAALTAANFSFNAGDGRCDNCGGLGYEKIEMQFMADVYVPCAICEGKRFKPDILKVEWNGASISDVLEMTVNEAVVFFKKQPKIASRLEGLAEVGLGYLPLGQPLNTLSGGESQRLKLVKYLSKFGTESSHALLLLDEPTTGLHKHDVARLIKVLHRLVDEGHSLIVIEHNLDVLKSADWIIEMGPESGTGGGEVVFTGTPEGLAEADTVTAPYMRETLRKRTKTTYAQREETGLLVAEDIVPFAPVNELRIIGAREHNLKNISVTIPHGQMTVVTGVSGSGKSTLAFDIVFAEGQRRFMESMSPYARQFVEQLPKPDLDRLEGISPTVAIEQRVTHGTRKSTVATITEVAQYLRLLYSRVGIQHSPHTGEPLISLSPSALAKIFRDRVAQETEGESKVLYLCAPLIRGRKGHHEPLANRLRAQGFKYIRADGKYIDLEKFQKLDRYREHDIEVVTCEVIMAGKHVEYLTYPQQREGTTEILEHALKIGKGACFLAGKDGEILSWLSTSRTDPVTGESFPELDPKHFSWNSARGWCPTCRGYGRIYDWMSQEEDAPEEIEDVDHGSICPTCNGERLNHVSRAVKLPIKDHPPLSLPELLRQTPTGLLDILGKLELDQRSTAIAKDVIPEVHERLKFMDQVGLGYLTLDRSTNTLSGGEAQRIRLAAQLGSNVSGVLYVLDEPSIGLHARDNSRLIDSMHNLRSKGNSLLIVEHDDDTMRAADRILDLGPGAGVHGGEILADGNLSEIIANEQSLTGKYLKEGIPHPLRGKYRPLPAKFNPKGRKKVAEWIYLQNARLRNLKGFDLTLPIGKLIMVCGVSGAGKSTLVRDLLKPGVELANKSKLRTLDGKTFRQFYPAEMTGEHEIPFDKLVNADGFRSVIEVDQSPIGKTPRSTPATYIGAFDIIRQYFGTLPEAKMRGFTAGTFSFNTKGGRCETCKGAGRVKLEMNFLPDTYVDCEDCGGSRYGTELADIRWNGKSIADVLNMTFEEAAEFFSFHSRLKDMLGLMVATGLGYLRLGQSSPTLSGGEAQRVKLVSELAKGGQTYREKSQGIQPRNLYLLEEPTIGLHLSDCERLIELLHRLVDQGHTVIVIEHHLDLIQEADYVVEIGPDGGEAGGHLLYQGNLAGIRKCKQSITAPFLTGTSSG